MTRFGAPPRSPLAALGGEIAELARALARRRGHHPAPPPPSMRLLLVLAFVAPSLHAAEPPLHAALLAREPAPARTEVALPLYARPGPDSSSHPTVALLKTEASSPLLDPKIAIFDALLFAELAARPEMILVERDELEATLDELHLQRTAATSSANAVHIGRWTGARIIVSARAVANGPGLTVAARIMGTETGAVIVADAAMATPDRFAVGARELADKIAAVIVEKSARLLPPPLDEAAQFDALRVHLNNQPPPPVLLAIHETRGAADSSLASPIVAEELARIWKTLGGQVSRDERAASSTSPLLVRAEACAVPGHRHGDFFSARAHVSIVVLDPSGRELSRDHQTEIVLEVSGSLALDAALQKAARVLAVRLLRALPSLDRS